jgi:hypothetical protein
MVSIQKKRIFFCGVLLAIWGIMIVIFLLHIIPVIKNPPRLPPGNTIYDFLDIPLHQYGILLAGFLAILSILSAIGLWFHRRWSRILSIIASSISFFYMSYFFLKGLKIYFLPTSIITRDANERIGGMEIDYGYPPILLYLFIMSCFVYILVIMFKKYPLNSNSDSAISTSNK